MGAASFGDNCSKCEGRPVRSKALDLGSNLEGVRGFESHPSHSISFFPQISQNNPIITYGRKTQLPILRLNFNQKNLCYLAFKK